MPKNSFKKTCKNTNFLALAENHQSPDRKKIVILEGGSRSGKSISTLFYLIQCAIQMEGIVITCVRQYSRTLEGTLIRDFHFLMKEYFQAAYNPDSFNKSSRIYTFNNKSIIEFMGFDNSDKARGASRDFLFINEATELPVDSYKQLQLRTRIQTIIDYNPSMEFWATDLKARDDVLSVHSTYKDNQFLEQSIIDEILGYEPTPENHRRGTADKWMWECFGLGMLSRPDHAIFRFVHETDEFPSKDIAVAEGYGLDFGFNAPTSVVHFRLVHNKLYVREIVYEKGLTIRPNPNAPSRPSVVQRLIENGVSMDDLIICDSASPGLIAELSDEGFNCGPADKKAGSVMLGIGILQRFDIHVLKSSMNLKRELNLYRWKTRNDGVVLQEPEKKDDHAIDALRYATTYHLQGMLSQTTQHRIKSRNGRIKRRR